MTAYYKKYIIKAYINELKPFKYLNEMKKRFNPESNSPHMNSFQPSLLKPM